MAGHVQIRFQTKQPQYSIPDDPYSVPVTVSASELSDLINSTLKGTAKIWNPIGFDFLVGGEFMLVPLHELLTSQGISSESIIDVEYFESFPPPEVKDGLQHDDWVSSVNGSNNWFLTGCYDNSVNIWNIEGKNVTTFQAHVGPVKAVKWVNVDYPISSFVTSSNDQTAMLCEWNCLTNTTQCLCVYRGHARSVDCIAVDPTKRWLATGSHDAMLKLWTLSDSTDVDKEITENQRKRLRTEGRSVANKTPNVTLSGHNEAVTSVQFTGTHEVCTASMDHTIRIWDLELGGMKSQLASTTNFTDIAYSPLNQCLLSASGDRHIRLWDPRSKDGNIVKTVFTSHTNWVTCVSWSTDCEYRFISGSHDQILKEWDIRSPKASYYDLKGHRGKILCCDWNNPKFLLSGGDDCRLEVYRTTT